MNFGMTKFQILSISKLLVINVLFWITQKKLWKFDSKNDAGIFLGDSSTSKTYRVFNKKTLVIEKSIHVVFDESWNNVSNESICSDDLEKDFGDLLIN